MNINEQTAKDIKATFWRILFQNQEKWKISLEEKYYYITESDFEPGEIRLNKDKFREKYKDEIFSKIKNSLPKEYEYHKESSKLIEKRATLMNNKGGKLPGYDESTLQLEKVYSDQKKYWKKLDELCNQEIEKKYLKEFEELINKKISEWRKLGYELIKKERYDNQWEQSLKYDVFKRFKTIVAAENYKWKSYNEFNWNLNKVDILLNANKLHEIKKILLSRNKTLLNEFNETTTLYLIYSRKIEQKNIDKNDQEFARGKEHCFYLWYCETMIKINEYIINTLCKTPSKVPA